MIVTIKLQTMKIKTDNRKMENKTMLEEGGIPLLMLKLKSKVVTSIEVFSPMRKATAPISLRLNKKETALTKLKITGAKNGEMLFDALWRSWINTISAFGA